MELTVINYKVPQSKKITQTLTTAILLIIFVPIVSLLELEPMLTLLFDAIILVVAIIYLMRVWVFDKRSITLVDDKILFLNGKKIKEEFSLAEHEISSYIVRHYYNGIPTGSDLYLQIFQGEAKKERNCRYLGKKQFNELMNQIDHRRHYLVKQEVDTTIASQDNVESQAYIFDEEKEFHLLKKEARSLHLYFSIFLWAALAIFTIRILYIFVIESKSSRNIESMLFLVLILILPAIILLIVLEFMQQKQIKQTPLYIKITPQEIIFNDLHIAKAKLQKIIVTPPSYTSSGRRIITIMTTDGATHTWYYGSSGNAKTREQYAEIVETLRDLTYDTVGVFEYKRI